MSTTHIMRCVGSIIVFLAIRNVAAAPVAVDNSLHAREANALYNDPDDHGDGRWPPEEGSIKAREGKDVTKDPDNHGNRAYPAIEHIPKRDDKHCDVCSSACETSTW
ncbi:uncharacterized protein MYCGRDRAFT_90421 [Zymoseptoria tritici IPO323]|uniref:Secreted protein n=1 Tax=Zymoseptoria tritici (strain CBS 115943 / IPO323) TaxID=336722 RepID=F9X3C6_ZYMTI|nr:uncharacterized protein MYCGRDRAFT_90421 [Zymoseptoria tritici IPO323]EGP90741.1 hypothetical protein MYCGRDRAFT_90421 [Zymoseptoria tritici IPO323]